MRTLLTMLGIIIGVGAVICSVGIGEGASSQIQTQIQALGDNLLLVFAGSVNQGGVHLGSQATKTLVAADANAIRDEIPLVSRISPSVGAGVQVVFGNQNWNTRATGASADYLLIRHWPLLRGSGFSGQDVDSGNDVCIIGTTVAQQLFGDADPTNQTIRVSNLPFRVIGELVSKGQSPFGGDQDDTMIMPYTTMQKKILGISWVQSLYISAASQDEMDNASKQIADLLRQRHHPRPDAPDDFMILNPTELAQAREQTLAVMELLLAAIASISLLIGGIGIMNIMLAGILERTREIGLRRAVGARRSDIVRQFVVEATMISFAGGTIGIVLGFIISRSIAWLAGWSTIVTFSSIALAFFVSISVGLLFGIYPATKAARLDPVEAIRYE